MQKVGFPLAHKVGGTSVARPKVSSKIRQPQSLGHLGIVEAKLSGWTARQTNANARS